MPCSREKTIMHFAFPEHLGQAISFQRPYACVPPCVSPFRYGCLNGEIDRRAETEFHNF